jgi:hypothetical protein
LLKNKDFLINIIFIRQNKERFGMIGRAKQGNTIAFGRGGWFLVGGSMDAVLSSLSYPSTDA